MDMKKRIKRGYPVMVMLAIFSVLCCSCEKEDITTATVTDHEGNVYKTVKIGDQWWMSESMRATTLKNGQNILKCPSNRQISYTEPMCYYYKGMDSLARIYGCLYNYAAAANICPEGWHLPTEANIIELRDYCANNPDFCVGDNKRFVKALVSQRNWYPSLVNAAPGYGSYLKSDYFSSQSYYYNSMNNKSGFNATPGGCTWMGHDSFYYELMYLFEAWEFENYDENYATGYYIHTDSTKLHLCYIDKSGGLAVRCVKGYVSPSEQKNSNVEVRKEFSEIEYKPDSMVMRYPRKIDF